MNFIFGHKSIRLQAFALSLLMLCFSSSLPAYDSHYDSKQAKCGDITEFHLNWPGGGVPNTQEIAYSPY